MSRFVIRNVPSGTKFDLKAGNGETIATSEVYVTAAGCHRGIASVRTYATAAAIEDLTVDSTNVRCPKFEVYKDRRNQYRFRLRAKNGKVVVASEGYTTKESCLGGIESVRRNAAVAVIAEET